MATWPVSLPTQLRIEGGTGELKSTAIDSPMDAGPSKRRNRYTAAPEPYSGSLILTSSQFTAFRTFFYTDTAGGTLTFDGLRHPITGATVTHRFTKPSKPPAWRGLGAGQYEVTLAVEVMP